VTRRARVLRIALVFAIFVVLGVLVMPGRLWVGQRNDIAQAQEQLDELKAENRRLTVKVDRLGSAALIEHAARENFGWVHPRDEVYTIPPAPPLRVELPEVWPFGLLQEPLAEAAADS